MSLECSGWRAYAAPPKEAIQMTQLLKFNGVHGPVWLNPVHVRGVFAHRDRTVVVYGDGDEANVHVAELPEDVVALVNQGLSEH